MRKFRTTAAIFVIGVLASKILTGINDTPLDNRFTGEVREGDWKTPKIGVNIDFEIARSYWGGDEIRDFHVRFTGKPEVMAKYGLPDEKVVCEVIETGIPKVALVPGKVVHFNLKGDNPICTAIEIGATEDNLFTIAFNGKQRMLTSEVVRNNSRGFIVGFIQSMNQNSWIQKRGV